MPRQFGPLSYSFSDQGTHFHPPSNGSRESWEGPLERWLSDTRRYRYEGPCAHTCREGLPGSIAPLFWGNPGRRGWRRGWCAHAILPTWEEDDGPTALFSFSPASLQPSFSPRCRGARPEAAATRVRSRDGSLVRRWTPTLKPLCVNS